MHTVRDQRDRAKQPAADDLGDHHGSVEPDHRPGFALTFLMTLSKEYMALTVRDRA
jgi:hypothetical protein